MKLIQRIPYLFFILFLTIATQSDAAVAINPNVVIEKNQKTKVEKKKKRVGFLKWVKLKFKKKRNKKSTKNYNEKKLKRKAKFSFWLGLGALIFPIILWIWGFISLLTFIAWAASSMVGFTLGMEALGVFKSNNIENLKKSKRMAKWGVAFSVINFILILLLLTILLILIIAFSGL